MSAVQAVLMSDYDTVNNPDLTIFIAVASPMVDQVVKMAAYKTRYNRNIQSPGASLQERVECYLAAHFYVASDRQLTTKSTSGASGAFAGVGGTDIEATSYGRAAILADISGCLKNIAKRQFASGFHIGRLPDPLARPGIGDITTLPFIGNQEEE